MITIDVNNDYGVQTGEFDITFTPINSTGNDMMVTAYIKDFNGRVLFHQDVTSGEEYSIHISKSQLEVWFNSVENKILLYAYASGEGTSEEYVSFMKLIMPEVIINSHLGNTKSSASLNIIFDITDIISPASQRSSTQYLWNDSVGILAHGVYLDDLDHAISSRAVAVEQIYLHDSRYGSGYVEISADLDEVSLGEHTIYIVYSMVRGDWDSSNPQNPWLYDNYAIVQKEVKINKTNQSFSWQTPKTTWHGEPFNIGDYNRIKGNLLYLHDLTDMFFDGSNMPELGSDKNYDDYYFANEFNAFENELQDINERSFDFDIGEKQEFSPLGRFIQFEECNRIEEAQLLIYSRLDRTVTIPYTFPLVYHNNLPQTPIWVIKEGHWASVYTKSGDLSAIEVGEYSTTFTLDEGFKWIDGTTEPKTIQWSITKNPIKVPTVNGEYIYNTRNQNVVLNPYFAQGIDVTGDLSGKNIGVYNLTYHILDSEHYMWADGTTADKNDSWTIEVRKLAIPTLKPYNFVYDGHTAFHFGNEDINNFDYAYMTQDCSYEYGAGTYSFHVTLRDTVNTQWEDGTTDPIELVWTVQRASVAIPVIVGTYTYNYEGQYVEFDGYDSDIMSKSGQYFAYDAGTYHPVVSIINSNYQFTDGTTEHEYTWVIERLVIVTPTVSGTYTYDGDEQEVQFNDYISYAMSKSQQYRATNAGTYTARVDITSVNFKFSDNKTYALIQWTIGKAAGYINLSSTDVVFGILTTATINILSSSGRITNATSSNINKATVSYNQTAITITGKSEGTPIITVSFAESDNYLAGTGTITVHCGYEVNDDISLFVGADASATIGNKTLFAGGYRASSGDEIPIDRVIAISNTLTKSTSGYPLPEPLRGMSGIAIGNYAIFAGGSDSHNRGTANAMAYTSNLTALLCEDLTHINNRMVSAKTPSYAVFGFGINDIEHIDAYNSSLTHTYRSISDISHNVNYNCNSISIGNYAVFAGGNSSGADEAVYLDDSLTITSNRNFLSVSRITPQSTEVGNYGLFAGGYPYSGGNQNLSVDVFNSSLTRSKADDLRNACLRNSVMGDDATTVGNYAIFTPSSTSNEIEIYDNLLTHTRGISGVSGVSGFNSDYALFHDRNKWIAIKKVD